MTGQTRAENIKETRRTGYGSVARVTERTTNGMSKFKSACCDEEVKQDGQFYRCLKCHQRCALLYRPDFIRPLPIKVDLS